MFSPSESQSSSITPRLVNTQSDSTSLFCFHFRLFWVLLFSCSFYPWYSDICARVLHVNYFCATKTKYPTQASPKRGDSFWLTVSEGLCPSQWVRHGRMRQFPVVGVCGASSSHYRDSGIHKNTTETRTRFQLSNVLHSQSTSVSQTLLPKAPQPPTLKTQVYGDILD